MYLFSLASLILFVFPIYPVFSGTCVDARDSCREILKAEPSVMQKVIDAWMVYLQMPEVQEILNLSPEQIDAFTRFDGDTFMMQPGLTLVIVSTDCRKTLETIMNALGKKQLEILHRIELQRSVSDGMIGTLFLRPDVSQRIELTEPQRLRMEEIVRRHEKERDTMTLKLRQRKATGRDRHEMIQKHDREALAVLSAKQRDCWARVILTSYPTVPMSVDTQPRR